MKQEDKGKEEELEEEEDGKEEGEEDTNKANEYIVDKGFVKKKQKILEKELIEEREDIKRMSKCRGSKILWLGRHHTSMHCTFILE